MVATELKTAVSTIRIHDEYCEATTEGCISRLNHIVSESYKRRHMQNRVDDTVVTSFEPENVKSI